MKEISIGLLYGLTGGLALGIAVSIFIYLLLRWKNEDAITYIQTIKRVVRR